MTDNDRVYIEVRLAYVAGAKRAYAGKRKRCIWQGKSQQAAYDEGYARGEAYRMMGLEMDFLASIYRQLA